MTKPDKTTGSGSNRRLAPVVASVALLGALLIPLLASSTANAATTAKKTTTTCVNYPSGSCLTTTTHHGPPTTKHHGVVITLTISYSHGIVTWQACLGVNAAGSTAQLYLNGVLMNEPGGSGVVLANGCTSDLSFPICLVTGTYAAVAVDPAFGAPNASLGVNNSGCANPITLGSATIANSSASGPGSGSNSSSTPSSSSGGLAFTGANIALLLLAAALLIVVGYAIVRLNRQRRRAT